MFSVSKFAPAASLILFASVPALAHPGHGPDNPILHRIVHWATAWTPHSQPLSPGFWRWWWWRPRSLDAHAEPINDRLKTRHQKSRFGDAWLVLYDRVIKGRGITVKSVAEPLLSVIVRRLVRDRCMPAPWETNDGG